VATTPLENEYKLDGAVGVVTGGASSIGLATVRAFQGVGAAVSVLDREALPSAGANMSIQLILRTRLQSSSLISIPSEIQQEPTATSRPCCLRP
jgi:NAD(P)-dependent dehydrogenase (short-subunit alcohol dehydrogenase family)